MKSIYIIAIVLAGLALLLVLFKLLKKGAKLAGKLPTNFLAFFLLFGLLGLLGFTSKSQVASNPFLIGILLLIVSLTGGIIMTNNLYEKWEWGMVANFGKKLLYLSGITLTAMVAFFFIFLLCEHRGWDMSRWETDLVWWLTALILIILLPLIIKQLHTLWNQIPKISQVIPVFILPTGSSPPFIESGGNTINFIFVIPRDYISIEVERVKVAAPYNISLGEVFHYALYEYNIIERHAKKIILAEDNKRAKVYAWSFYRNKLTWWGWFTKKLYIDPKLNLISVISRGETIFVERVKIWEQQN